MNKNEGELLNNHILSIFRINPKKKFNYRQILIKLPKKENSNQVKKSLFFLEQKKQIKQINPGSYILLKNKKSIKGIFDKTKKGSGYIIQENVDKDVFVSEKNTKKAFDGDFVECVLISNREAEIIKIIKRNKTTFVGVVYIKENITFVETSSLKDKLSFNIPNNKTANNNDLVVVEFNNWEKELPEGEIVKIIGKKGVVEDEMHAILEEFELPYEFSKELENEAKQLERLQNERETKKRKT